jgi:hypothetical protein
MEKENRGRLISPFFPEKLQPHPGPPAQKKIRLKSNPKGNPGT